MMTVRDLKLMLEEWDENLVVLMSSDSEGNQFSPLAEIGDGLGVQATAWEWDVFNLDEQDEAPNAKPVVVLWPTN